MYLFLYTCICHDVRSYFEMTKTFRTKSCNKYRTTSYDKFHTMYFVKISTISNSHTVIIMSNYTQRNMLYLAQCQI